MNRIELVRNETGALEERELVYRPTSWQREGLQETASGYGRRLNSGYMIQYAGKLRRVYITCYSNASSLFVLVAGEARYL